MHHQPDADLPALIDRCTPPRAVLDEELVICFQRTVDGEIEHDFAAFV
jgi:hypothetical protein